MKTIDVTPTWVQWVGILEYLIENTTEDPREVFKRFIPDLMKMAQSTDRMKVIGEKINTIQGFSDEAKILDEPFARGMQYVIDEIMIIFPQQLNIKDDEQKTN